MPDNTRQREYWQLVKQVELKSGGLFAEVWMRQTVKLRSVGRQGEGKHDMKTDWCVPFRVFRRPGH